MERKRFSHGYISAVNQQHSPIREKEMHFSDKFLILFFGAKFLSPWLEKQRTRFTSSWRPSLATSRVVVKNKVVSNYADMKLLM